MFALRCVEDDWCDREKQNCQMPQFKQSTNYALPIYIYPYTISLSLYLWTPNGSLKINLISIFCLIDGSFVNLCAVIFISIDIIHRATELHNYESVSTGRKKQLFMYHVCSVDEFCCRQKFGTIHIKTFDEICSPYGIKIM